MCGRSYSQWPGSDDKAVVAEMLANPNSNHWFECRNFIQKVVQMRGAAIPDYFKEDVVQNTMMAVVTGLANFRFDCKLTSWLTLIANRRVIDMARKHLYDRQWIHSPSSFSEETENEVDTWNIPDSKTAEEECVIREKLREVNEEMLAYLPTRLHSARDQQILEMFWFDGLNHEEIAERVGVSAPVVGYVIRSIQSHLRKKIKGQPPPELPL